MKTQLKSSIALITAALLAGSALASESKQDTSFLKGKKEEAPVIVVVQEVAPAPVAAENTKDKYFAMEATYNFNEYKPAFTGKQSDYKDFNKSGSLGLGLGMFVNQNVRADVMLSYIVPTDFKFHSMQNTYKSEVSTTKLMLNGTYDFGSMAAGLAPYISAGIGAAYNDYDTEILLNGEKTNTSGHKIDFAYQAGVGVAYKMQNDMSINLGYRFADNGNVKKINGVTSDRLQSHAVLLGLQVPF
jgi:opacity protein-like surface antigen